MKKRLLSLALCIVMIFSLLPSFAMASVYPINESGSETEHAPAVVFYNGSTEVNTQYVSSAESEVYDPGVPAAGSNQTFQGWYLSADFSGEAMTIEQLNAYIQANYAQIKAAGELDVYAKMANTYYVTYVAQENGNTIVQKVAAITLPDGATSYDYTVDISYTPPGANQQFKGWGYNGSVYQMDQTVTVSPAADITLTANVANGYWVTFNENDKPDASTNYHASYQAPVFVEEGQSLNLDNIRVEAKGYNFVGWFTAAVGGTQVHTASAAQTVYAHWTIGTASYRVIYWVQKTSDAVGLGNDAKSYDYYGSRTATATTGTTVSTVNNDTNKSQISTPLRNYVTFNSAKSNTSATLAADGSTVLNVYYDRSTITFNFGHYRYNRYVVDQSFSGLYGAPFTQWPKLGSGNCWTDGNSNFPLALTQFVPTDNTSISMNFYSTQYSSGYHLYVVGQNTNGNYDPWVEITDSDSSSTTDYWYPTETFIGFTMEAYQCSNQSSPTPCTSSGRVPKYGSYVRLYYARNQWNLVYNSNNTNVKSESVYYDKELSGYANYVPTNGPEGTYFGGWYADPSCTQAFDFSGKMPDNAVTVYAKWIDIRYRVVLELNGGSLDSGTSFKVEYRKTVDITKNPTKEGFTFIGWFTDPEYAHPYNLSTLLTDASITDKTYREESDPTVRGKLTLYAKWRAALQGDGFISVVYDADGHGTAPVDSNKYADQSSAFVQSAPTNVAEGYTFLRWEKVKTGEKYYPGETFTIDAADADYSDPHYTITLKAIYRSLTTENTFLKYDLNGGGTFKDDGEATKTLTPLVVNGAVTLLGETDINTSELFLGWNHVKSAAEAGQVEFEGGATVGVDNLPDDSNTLYAVYALPLVYLADFNAKMKVATNATAMNPVAKKDNAPANGTFTFSGSAEQPADVIYQLNHDDVIGSTLAMSGVDTADVNGIPVNQPAGTKSGWNRINVIPASSVYFDDDLVNTTLTMGDGSGYNEGVNADAGDALSKGTYTITFTGTGIDVYCTTASDGGYMQAKLEGSKLQSAKLQTIRNYDKEITRYNVPSVSFRDLEYGDYTLTLNILNSSNYKFDGVRVYGMINDQEQYKGTTEQYAAYINMRDALVNNETTTAFSDNMTDAVLGALFIDDASKLSTQQQAVDAQTGDPVVDDNGDPVMIDVYANTFDAYKANSPKHEIYLAKNQAITFQLTETAMADGTKAWIGLSAPDAGKNTGTVTVNSTSVSVTSGVDMYYPLPAGVSSITITNTGDNLISVTNLKITGSEAIYNAANAAKAAPADPESPTTLSVQDAVSMVFQPVTMRTVKLAANNGVDPDAPAVTPEDPDPAPQQTIRDIVRQLLSDFVSRLFSSIGRLFQF